MKNLKNRNKIFSNFCLIFVAIMLAFSVVFGIDFSLNKNNFKSVSAAETYVNADEYLLPLVSDQTDILASYDISKIYPIYTENQTNSELCWAYAGLKSLETTLIAQTGEYYNFSETAVAYFAYINGINQSINSTGNFERFNVVVKNYGLVYENDFSNDKYFDIDESNYQNYLYLTEFTTKDIMMNVNPIRFADSSTYTASSLQIKENVLKQYIEDYGGIFVGIEPGTIYRSDTGYMYINKVDHNTEDGKYFEENHAVCIIGYDNYGFIALNSWGMEESYNSRFYIPFDYGYIYDNAYGYIYNNNEKVSLVSSNANDFSQNILKSDKVTKNYFNYGEDIDLTYSVSEDYNFKSIYVSIIKGTEDVTDKFVINYNDDLRQIYIQNGETTPDFVGGTYLIKIYEDVNLISVKNISIFTGTEVAYFKLTKDDVLDTIDSYALFNGMASSQNNMTFYIFGSGSYTLDFFLTNLNKNYATGLFISTSRQFVYETIGGDVVKTSLSKNFQIFSNTITNKYTIVLDGLSDYVGKRIEFIINVRSVTNSSVTQSYFVNIFVGSYGTASTNLTNSIEYVLDGGKNSEFNVSKYPNYSLESGMTQVELFSPSKSGYSFLGWYLDENFENQIFNISASNVGDLVLYALFERNDLEYFETDVNILSVTDYDGLEKDIEEDIIYGDSVKLNYNFTVLPNLAGSGRNYTLRYYLYVNGEEVGGATLNTGTQDVVLNFDFPELGAGDYNVEVVTAVVISHSLNLTATSQKEFVVNKKMVDFAFDNKALKKVYCGEPYDPKQLEAITFLGVYAEDLSDFTYTLSDTPKTDYGSYKYYISSISNDNYAFDEELFGVLYIEQKLLTVDWKNINVTYNGELQYAKYELDGVMPGDSVDLVLAGDGQKDVGEYKVTVSGISNSNYKVDAGAYTTIKINPATITITFEDVTDRLQTDPLYREEVKYTINGTIYNNDDIKLEVISDGLTSKKSGRYTITGKCNNPNYQAYFNDAIYTLTGYYYVYYLDTDGNLIHEEIVNDGEDPKGLNNDIYPKGFLDGYLYSESLENKGMDLYITVRVTNYAWIIIAVVVVVVFVAAYLIVTRKQRKNKVS